MTSVSKLALAVTLAGAVAALAGPAVAGCKRMGFLVNDYGKDGPTNDAKSLLDKHIAQWAAEQGIEKYTVGKKDVKCDLFLNLIVVDEHTCTASATVCWGNEKMPAGERETAAGGDAISEPKPKKAKKEAAAKTETKPAESKPEEKAAETKPVEVKSDEPKAAAAETSAPTKVETGALPLSNKSADTPAPASDAKAAATTPASHEAATSAAEAAAAAAERAAQAAERAAAAAERAAAALAASGASAPAMPGAADTAAAASSTVAVPPLAAEGASKP
jgi:hypothetical protein